MLTSDSICLTAIDGVRDEPFLLRSYHYEHNLHNLHILSKNNRWIKPYNTGTVKMKVWQVARATSAAPTFFNMLTVELDGEKRRFQDGGTRANNPSYVAYVEHCSLNGVERPPALLLSVGTGLKALNKDGFARERRGFLGLKMVFRKLRGKWANFRHMETMYTDSEDRHKIMELIGRDGWYKRLNVNQGLEDVSLGNWVKGEWTNPQTRQRKIIPGGKTLTTMEEATRTYLNRDTVSSPGGRTEHQLPKVIVEQVAERLVRHRRLREATKADDPTRWEKYMGQWLTGSLKPEDGKREPAPLG